MSMEWVPWVTRAILVMAGIITVIIVWKGKKEGRYQEYHFRVFAIGMTSFILGVILLIVSLITDLFWDYGLFLTAVGAISLIIGLVMRNRWKANR